MKRFIGRVQDDGLHSHPAPERYQQYQVLWRGYLANREDVIKEAARRRTPIRDGSEGELFALAYQWWDDDMQAHLLGEYAVAIFDIRTASLLLTHDALGLLPLFYGSLPDGVFFGSHLEDVVLAMGGDDLDEEYLAEFIAKCSYLSDRTPYRAVRRLGMGRSLLYRGGRIVWRRSWELPATEPVMVEDKAYEEDFRSLLNQGVAAALQAPGPVWSELSGGLDSATIVCLAARTGARPLEVLSRVYDRYREADESAWIRLVLDQHPLPWHPLDGDQHLPYSELPDRFLGEPGLPMIDWSINRCYEAMMRTHGVAAVLTGQGGDIAFMGVGSEPYYLADLARTLKLRRLFAELSRWRLADRQQRSSLYWMTHYVLRPLANRWRRRPPRPSWQLETSPWIHPEFARKMARQQRHRPSDSSRGYTVDQGFFLEMLSTLMGHITQLNQIPQTFEYRHPLLFRPLVEFMFNLPWSQKLQPDADRFLQRRALQGILPEAVRLKRGKVVNDQIYFEGLRHGGAWCELLTDDPRVADLGIVDRGGWIEAVGRARMGLTHYLPQFEAVAMLEIWLRQRENLSRAPALPLYPPPKVVAGPPAP